MNKSILIKTHKDNIIDVIRLTNCPKETVYVFDTFSKVLQEFGNVESVNYQKFIKENLEN